MTDSWRRLKNAGYRTRLYRYTLERNQIDRLVYLPQDPWPGDPDQANELFRGRYRFAGREANAPNQPPWRLRPDDAEWQAALHDFEWLRHFEAAGGAAALSQAKRLIRSWIDLCGDIDPVTWSPGVLGRRLTAWLVHGRFLLKGADSIFVDADFGSMAAQWQHLQRVAGDAEFGSERFNALVGLVYGAMAFPGREALIAKYLQQIERLMDQTILPDGGYYSRAPSDLLAALQQLIALRQAVEGRKAPVPDWLHSRISLMSPQLRGLRHGDGGLALFNGGHEAHHQKVDAVLKMTDGKDQLLLSAVQSGFQRLVAVKTILLAETGAPPAGNLGQLAHSGGGGFELSIGKRRLVVNCGSGRYRSQEWREAARATAAHSTLHIENANAWPIGPDGAFGPQPAPMRCRRHEDDEGNAWLELGHDGYLKRFGLIHHRRLYLGASGKDIRGEDRLDASGLQNKSAGKSADISAGAKGFEGDRAVVVRFHLHPEVQASALHGGGAVLLRLSDGQGWRFRANGAETALQDSIYLGRTDSVRRSQQIVLSTTTSGDPTLIKWAFQRI